MTTQYSNKRYIAIGLMLFALFFGAGNLIFPASMGQNAGQNVWWAVLGFCITGAGMPLLSVMAMGHSGCNDLQEAASRVHPLYGLFFTIIVYLAIGPCFAIPRTGTVAYEIAVRPFLADEYVEMGLPIFLALFFLVSFWLSASPQKLVDRIGKLLTPALVLTIVLLIMKSFHTPLGEPQEPTAAYATPVIATVQGIIDGYNTLDAIAAFVFATLVVGVVRDESGFTDPKVISSEVYKSGIVAVAFLAFIYIFIAKIGAESVPAIGMQDTGAPVLAETAKILFGNAGAVILAVIVMLACLSTAIGLITCCAAYFLKLTRRFNYLYWVIIFSVIPFLVGLFGLKTIIVSAVPVLMFIYPLAVVKIVLLFTHDWFEGRQCVYAWTVGLTFIMAFINGLEAAGVMPESIESVLQAYVPLHSVGMGWIGFAVVGYALGLVWKKLNPVK